MKKTLWLALILLLVCVFAFSACDEGNEPQTPDNDHVHAFGEWTTVKDATCTVKGEQERSCSCGEKETKSIPASHTEGEWIIENNATCTENGSKYQVCSVCFVPIKTDDIASAGHHYVSVKIEPTKSTKGYTNHKCSCGNEYNDNYVDALIVITPGDKIGPELISFTLDITDVKVGDIINFTAEISDDSSIECAEFQFKLGADWHNVFLEHSDGNIYKGQLKITNSFINGTYSISWIYLNDYADNSSDPQSDVSFTVTNENSTVVIAQDDKTGPELISFTIDKTDVKVGDIINFTAEISDDSSINYAEFQFKLGADYHNVFLDYIDGNTYKGQLKITNSFLNGTYNISWISIEDYAGNSSYPQSDVSFTVTNESSTIVIAPGDKTGPELISFTLDKTDVKVGDIINFTAEICDESSIDCAQFQFKLGADWHNVFLEHIEGNTYKGQLKITNSFVNGVYSVSHIYLNDYANNSSNPRSDVTFTVVK